MAASLRTERMQSDPDLDLVARARSGDRDAFAQLVHRHRNAIYGLCRRLVGRSNLAEEAAQDTFLAAWRALPRFRAEASFAGWLKRIAVNTCKNRHRRDKVRAADQHESIDTPVGTTGRPRLELLPGGLDTGEATWRSQARDLLQRGLDALSEEQRQIIVLRDLEDLDYDEIGTLLDLPRGTVKSRLHRARAQLARTLKAHLRPEDVFDT